MSKLNDNVETQEYSGFPADSWKSIPILEHLKSMFLEELISKCTYQLNFGDINQASLRN